MAVLTGVDIGTFPLDRFESEGRAECAEAAVVADNLGYCHIALDAVPVASLSFPVFEATAGGVREARRTITGAGLAPVGFQVNFRRRERVQPFAQVSGGFLYFSERVPNEGGAQFNFTGDVGGGGGEGAR